VADTESVVADADVRVLVVDDHPSFLRSVARLISATDGFVVAHTAATGDGALAVLGRDHDIDLVLLDVHLPDRSGIEVARSYSLAGGTAVVALMSTCQLGDLPDDALSGGVAGFVPKEQLTMATLRAVWGAAAR
jgi:DNA-binding NarL/FixJ family response regulator